MLIQSWNCECGQGFDVDYFPHPCGGIFPHILEDKYDYHVHLGLYARLGLHCYNLDKVTMSLFFFFFLLCLILCIHFVCFVNTGLFDLLGNQPQTNRHT